MLQVLRLFFDLRGAQVKEVHFQATLGPSYVYASQSEIQQAVNQFLGVQGTPGPQASSAKPSKEVKPQQPPDHSKATPAAARHHHHPSADTNLVSTSYGKQLAQGIKARKEKVPVYYPTVLETGSDYAQKPRVYKINGKGDGAPPHDERAAYKYVFSLPGLGDYYGFEGTRWKDPPILDDPSDDEDDRRPRLQALLRRRPAAHGGLANGPGLVLGLQLADRDGVERGHAQDRRGLPPAAGDLIGGSG